MLIEYFVRYFYPGGNGIGWYICDSLGRGGFGKCYEYQEDAQFVADKLNKEAYDQWVKQ